MRRDDDARSDAATPLRGREREKRARTIPIVLKGRSHAALFSPNMSWKISLVYSILGFLSSCFTSF